jgi:hypothetical protein
MEKYGVGSNLIVAAEGEKRSPAVLGAGLDMNG